MATCCPTLTVDDCSTAGSGPGKTQALAWVRLAFAALIASQTMTYSLGVNDSPPQGLEKIILHSVLAGSALLVFLLLGLPLVAESVTQLRAGKMGIEQMFLIGIVGAYAASLHSSLTGQGAVYYEVVAILLTIYTLGTLVGENRRRAALESAQSLRRQYDLCFRLDEEGKPSECAAAEIETGDRIVVYADGGIPVDGRIAEGTAFVQETALTGEPFPVVREAGDLVLAGSRVVDERLVIEALSPGKTRKLDLLLARVEEARRMPSSIQKEADRIIAWFMPLVLLISLLTVAGWTLAQGWVVGLFNGLAVLVVACPCAMGMATPIGIMSALNALAKRGLVARSGDLIEGLARVDTVVFDKTGTLSEEALQLVEFEAEPGFDREKLRSWMGALQAGSSHPIARAFRDWASTVGSSVVANEVQVLPGAGIRGRITEEDRTWLVAVGNRSILGQETGTATECLKKLRAKGPSLLEIYVTVNGQAAAVALLREHLRAGSREAMDQFRTLGLHVEIMSGDRPERLEALGFPEAEAGLLPEDKARRVAEMEKSGRRVLFVGDGINDAAAMARASVSIALGSGADLTREVASGQFFGADLNVLAWARRQSMRVMRGIRLNLYFAGFYNFIGIALAVTGVLHPVSAAVLMLVSSATVTWRALQFGNRLQEDAEAVYVSGAEHARVDRLEAVLKWGTGVSGIMNRLVQKLSISGVLLGAAMLAQGWLINYLGGLDFTAVLMVDLFVLPVALWLMFAAGAWLEKGMSVRILYASMLAIGNLGMLAGWWMDAGFAPVVKESFCAACCGGGASPFQSLHWNWMEGGMVLSSLPLLFGIDVTPQFVKRPFFNHAWLHALFCIGGMLAGMRASGVVMQLVESGDAQGHYLWMVVAMTAGMFTGMILFCRVYFKWLLGAK